MKNNYNAQEKGIFVRIQRFLLQLWEGMLSDLLLEIKENWLMRLKNKIVIIAKKKKKDWCVLHITNTSF